MKLSGDKKITFCFAVLLFLIPALSPLRPVFADEKKIPQKHPVELTARPRCTECHPDKTTVALKPIVTFNHSGDWTAQHRFYAVESFQLCNACHKVSFCTDCHASKNNLKPSDKYSESTERWLPHRGDYLFQHRIDGRIDPASCFRCHGRQNNGICKRCHK